MKFQQFCHVCNNDSSLLWFKARIVLYSQKKQDLVLIFNARNTNSTNWFTDANLQCSPWQDINAITDKNFFSLAPGVCDTSATSCRDFHINYHYGGCDIDTGWLTIGNMPNSCDWEKNVELRRFCTAKRQLL